jgi:hypothetical protein
LQIVDVWDALQQVLVVLACVLELALDVCFGPHGCAKDGEPLFLGEQVLATGPNFWAEGFQAWLCLAELKNSFLEFFLCHFYCVFFLSFVAFKLIFISRLLS